MEFWGFWRIEYSDDELIKISKGFDAEWNSEPTGFVEFPADPMDAAKRCTKFTQFNPNFNPNEGV